MAGLRLTRNITGVLFAFAFVAVICKFGATYLAQWIGLVC